MKYTITQIFSFKDKKFEIIRDSKLFCTVKTAFLHEYKNRYSVKFSNQYDRETTCDIEPDPEKSQCYLIFLTNNQNNKRRVFAQLSYQFIGCSDCLYTIIIGRNKYQIRSCDLKHRCLTIVDEIQSSDASAFYCPKTLFQVLDSFSKSTKTYHVIINDKKSEYGYLAIVILLYLHEYKRSIS